MYDWEYLLGDYVKGRSGCKHGLSDFAGKTGKVRASSLAGAKAEIRRSYGIRRLPNESVIERVNGSHRKKPGPKPKTVNESSLHLSLTVAEILEVVKGYRDVLKTDKYPRLKKVVDDLRDKLIDIL